MTNPTAKMTAEQRAMRTAEAITNTLFMTSCDHCDDGYCDRCIKDYLPEMIFVKIQQAAAQAREEGFDEGYKKGVEAQFNEAESITVRRITPSRYVQGFEQAREMAAKVGDYFGLPQGHIIASEIRALKPRARGSGD